MKKIATITTHSALNYGAVLQAFALNKWLIDQGYKCEVLDYQPEYVAESYRLIKKPRNFSDIFLMIFQMLHYLERKDRKEKFEQFRKAFIRTTYEMITNKEELILLANEYDLIVCGSDQIWNPKLHHFDESYFLSYPEIKTKRMSYAASFGQDFIDEKFKSEISRRISTINKFGCREESALKIIEEIKGITPTLVLDPVFLLPATIWSNLCKNFNSESKNYILVYFLSNPGNSLKNIQHYAKKTGKDLISIGFSPRDILYQVEHRYDLGPQEFLDSISKSELIITNSFHATAFAIIFHKQFYVRLKEGKDSRNDRILTLLKILGLESRTFTDSTSNNINYDEMINYEIVDTKLKELVKNSQRFLKDSVDELTNTNVHKVRITAKSCTACGACVSICPTNCIEIRKNEYGFYYPEINSSHCIKCNACSRVCPANQRFEGVKWTNSDFYAMWAKDEELRWSGSSGGVFGLLADEVLDNRGVVYGAAFSEDYKSVVMTSTESTEITNIKKSKYVESKTGNIFKDVKKKLDEGILVLYCGTSCQIDGLKNYLKKDYSNLLTCDFLCHGVPAAGLFEKYVNGLELKYGKLIDLSFRSKYYGWKAYCIKSKFKDGKEYIKNKLEDPYFRLFFENIALRENCFNCERLEKSNADITLGDFWGVKNIPEINDTNEGISMVVVHTKIGEQWLEKIRDKSIVYKLNQESVSYAYRKRSYTIKNQRMTLKSLYEKKNILDLTISRKIRIKGKIYKIRAINQKRKMKFEG